MIQNLNMTSCHLKYILGYDNCLGLNNYIRNHVKLFNDLKRKEYEVVDITRMLDKNRWIVEKKPTPSTKGKKKDPNDIEIDQPKMFIPCHHNGSCDGNTNCECYAAGRNCERFCHCRGH